MKNIGAHVAEYVKVNPTELVETYSNKTYMEVIIFIQSVIIIWLVYNVLKLRKALTMLLDITGNVLSSLDSLQKQIDLILNLIKPRK